MVAIIKDVRGDIKAGQATRDASAVAASQQQGLCCSVGFSCAFANDERSLIKLPMLGGVGLGVTPSLPARCAHVLTAPLCVCFSFLLLLSTYTLF